MAKEMELLCRDYEEIRHTPSGAAVEEGVVVSKGDVYGFTVAEIADGKEGILVVRAENVKAAKEASLAITAGDAVYFDTSAKEVDKTDTNKWVGYATKDAALADTHVEISFDGNLAKLQALIAAAAAAP